MKRALSPATNATGLGAAAAAIYAAVVMILNVAHHRGVIDPQVIVAAIGAAAFIYARFKVTPVADPRDGNGKPLAPAYSIDVAALSKPPEQRPQNVTASPPSNVTMVPGQPAVSGENMAPPPVAHP